MTRLYQKIWSNKNKLLFLFVTIFILSTIKLNNINVFFESERIIEELADSDFLETNSINKINDQNILLLGVALKEKVKYEEALKFKIIQTSLRESKNINRVFSFINEKQVFETKAQIWLNTLSIEDFEKAIEKRKIAIRKRIEDTK